MADLFTAIISDSALRLAWAEVLERDESDGTLSAGVRRFREAADEQLERLAFELRSGGYQPASLTEVRLEDDDIVVLQRFGRREHHETVPGAIRQMRSVLALLGDSTGRNEIMGIEGAAAARYFPCLGQLVPPELRFEVRSRQPPLDVANSALSFLYTVLLGECACALWSAGLDPAIGVLHSESRGRPSLGLDLMEEFRPLVVDQTVLHATRTGVLTAASGTSDPGRSGVFLTKKARSALLEAYERRMLRHTRGALPDFAGTLRRHLYRQAQRLSAAICRDEPWTGLSWR